MYYSTNSSFENNSTTQHNFVQSEVSDIEDDDAKSIRTTDENKK